MDTEKRRRTMSEKLKQDVDLEEKAKGERRFYINLPLKHEFHIMGEVQKLESLMLL